MQVWHVQHVRNGSLESFTQVLFNDLPSYKNLMAIAFDADPNDYRIAVINLDQATMKLDPEYWRSRIHGAINAWNDSWDTSKGEYTIKFPFVPKPSDRVVIAESADAVQTDTEREYQATLRVAAKFFELDNKK